MRVATWRASTPVAVPPALTETTPTGPAVIAVDSDRSGQIVLPSRWQRRVETHRTIHSDRAAALDKARADLVAGLTTHPLPGGPTAAEVAQWCSPAHFASLALALAHREGLPAAVDALRERRARAAARYGWEPTTSPIPSVWHPIATDLETWRARDRRLWEAQAHGRAGAIDARDDAYRRAAAWLTDTAAAIVVDDTSVAEIARRPDPSTDPRLPSPVIQRAARQRTAAAPGRLRELVVAAAARRGVPVTVVDHTGCTRTHYQCGHRNPADGRYARSRLVTCEGCGRGYDQDASATLLMLAAGGAAPAPGSDTSCAEP